MEKPWIEPVWARETVVFRARYRRAGWNRGLLLALAADALVWLAVAALLAGAWL
jgi:hypothetical protein